MEKLQKALQKARENRGSAPEPTPVAEVSASPEAIAPQVHDRWAQLRPFQPAEKTLEKSRVVTTTANRLSNHFDVLRTKLLLMMRKNGWKRLAVTSPTMHCGKTTTACNLAIGSARNTDLRTILLELDLRRPSIAATLGLPDGPHLTDVLGGSVDFAEQAQRYRDNVAISAAYAPAKDPAAILLSLSAQSALQQIEDHYEPDLMIFDLPPLLVSDDTRAVLKDMDCALLVARAGKTTLSQIDACEREIAEHTNMLGVVLNQCRDADEEYDYYE